MGNSTRPAERDFARSPAGRSVLPRATVNINCNKIHNNQQEINPKMASVEEVRAGIAVATQQASEGMAALQQASSSLEQAQSALTMATQGSTQSDADQANGLLAQAVRQIGEATNSVSAAISTAESYAARL